MQQKPAMDEYDVLAPIDFFFSKEVDCFEGKEISKKHFLPALSEHFGEESFAKAYLAWQPAGLLFKAEVTLDAPIRVHYPDIRQGDCIELFIDTRPLTASKTTHRFCHHFYFLPERFEGHIAGERTRFRTEDTHPLCDEELLECTQSVTKKGYTASLFIPKECLVGYEGQKGSSLGFTYRIQRHDGPIQHFSMAYEHARLDTMPCLWTTLRLL